MSRDSSNGEVEGGIELGAAIEMIRDGLIAARGSGAGKSVQLPVESMTLELKVVASRDVGGKAGFKVPFVHAEVGVEGGLSREATQTVTISFGEPIGEDGLPVPIAQATDEIKE